MGTTRADSKKRVVLPAARPGDVFDIQEQQEGRYLLVRLQRPEAAHKKSIEQCLDAIAARPLTPKLSWEELRRLTREP